MRLLALEIKRVLKTKRTWILIVASVLLAVFRRRGAACRIRFVGFMEHNIHYICRVGRLYSDSVFTCQRWLPVVVEKNKIRKAVSEFSGIWNCINRNHSNKFSFMIGTS
jgi:hypothetical protein